MTELSLEITVVSFNPCGEEILAPGFVYAPRVKEGASGFIVGPANPIFYAHTFYETGRSRVCETLNCVHS